MLRYGKCEHSYLEVNKLVPNSSCKYCTRKYCSTHHFSVSLSRQKALIQRGKNNATDLAETVDTFSRNYYNKRLTLCWGIFVEIK